MQRGVIDKEAMSLFAVLTQDFTVIAAQDDHCALVQTLLLEKVDQSRDLRVRKRNLAVVRAILVLAVIWCGRPIRIMRIVKMHPEKKLLLIIFSQPVKRNIGHDIRGTFHFFQVRFLEPAEIEVVVIEVKSAIQAK